MLGDLSTSLLFASGFLTIGLYMPGEVTGVVHGDRYIDCRRVVVVSGLMTVSAALIVLMRDTTDCCDLRPKGSLAFYKKFTNLNYSKNRDFRILN